MKNISKITGVLMMIGGAGLIYKVFAQAKEFSQLPWFNFVIICIFIVLLLILGGGLIIEGGRDE